MGTDLDSIPRETPVEGTNKVAMSRIEVADLFCPTTQMEPLFADEEHVPLADSNTGLPNATAAVSDAHLSAVPAPPIFPTNAAPLAIENGATDATMKNRSFGTSLGVAPLEPATTVRAPFVVDTPVPRRSPLGPSPIREPWPESSAKLPSTVENVRERTAMLALDPSSGMPRPGPWQALVAVAKSLRGVRWWLSRRDKTSRIRPIRH
jgi:hypothetical protein